jgi:hypothetical protein
MTMSRSILKDESKPVLPAGTAGVVSYDSLGLGDGLSRVCLKST